MVGRYKKTGLPWRKIISLRKLVSDLRPIDILTGEIAVEVTGVVGMSPPLWYFKYIASIVLTRHKRLCLSLVAGKAVHSEIQFHYRIHYHYHHDC
jgi:hypothetical protein